MGAGLEEAASLDLGQGLRPGEGGGDERDDERRQHRGSNRQYPHQVSLRRLWG